MKRLVAIFFALFTLFVVTSCGPKGEYQEQEVYSVCPDCNGAGTIRKYVDCPSCDKGWVVYGDEPDNNYKCGRCDGNGGWYEYPACPCGGKLIKKN